MSEIFEQEYLAVYRGMERFDSILSNEKLSPADRIILVVLERIYPTVHVDHTPVAIWQLAKEAGVTRQSVSAFFVAMHERGYMWYIVHRRIDRSEEGVLSYRSECSVRELEACNRPWELNTRDTPKRKEHRKKVKERLVCRNCGSIEFRVVLQCSHCGSELKHDLD